MKLAIALVLIATSAAAQTATVTDGDTLHLSGTVYRLWGIDAPETHQVCTDGWRAGIEAKLALERLVAGKTVTCENRGADRYGRTISLCRANGEDLQAAMVQLGMAWAFVRYSFDYVDQEARAKAESLGVHAHKCEPPWLWRSDQPRGVPRQ